MQKETRKIIESAIQMEEDGIRFYTDAADTVENPLGQRLFKSLVEDERKHLLKLRKVFEGLGFSEEPFRKHPNLKSRVRTIFSSVPEEAAESLDAHASEIDVLRAALRMEEEGIRFYSSRCLPLGGEAGRLAGLIVKEEKIHRDVLQNTLTYLTDRMTWSVETENWFFEG